MKLNFQLALVMGLIAGLAGLSKDLNGYVDSLNMAKQAGNPPPAFDLRLTVTHVVAYSLAAFTGALGISQIPGVAS